MLPLPLILLVSKTPSEKKKLVQIISSPCIINGNFQAISINNFFIHRDPNIYAYSS